MLKKMQALKNKKRSGFSLMELVVVMVIIGILALMIVPQIGEATKNAKKATFTSNCETLKSAVAVWQSGHNGDYPTVGQKTTFESTCMQGTFADLTAKQKPTTGSYESFLSTNKNKAPNANVSLTVENKTFTYTWKDGLTEKDAAAAP